MGSFVKGWRGKGDGLLITAKGQNQYHGGKGYGSRAVETLMAEYPNKTRTVDFEMLDESAPNSAQRKKRRSFYLRNCYQETGLFLSYLGVDYEVFCMGESFDADTFKAMMKTIQVEGFNPRYFAK